MNCCWGPRRPPTETFYVGDVKISIQGSFPVRYSAVKYLEYLDTYYAVAEKTGPFEWTVFFGSRVRVKRIFAENRQSAIRRAVECINTLLDREKAEVYRER